MVISHAVQTCIVAAAIHLYYQINPDQVKDIYYYSIRAAFYVKDDRVYATNNAESIDQYSGKSIREMTKILGALKA